MNVGSIGDRLSLPFGAPLVSSKWAFASITESLRMELRPWGIHVVLIEPATIQTDAVKKVKEDAERVMSKMTPPTRVVRRDLPSDDPKGDRAREFGQRSRCRRPGGAARSEKEAATHALRRRQGWPTAGLLGRMGPDRLFDAMRVRLFGLPKKFGAAAQPVNGVAR